MDVFCQLQSIEGYWDWMTDPKPLDRVEDVLTWNCKAVQAIRTKKTKRAGDFLAASLQKKPAAAKMQAKKKVKPTIGKRRKSTAKKPATEKPKKSEANPATEKPQKSEAKPVTEKPKSAERVKEQPKEPKERQQSSAPTHRLFNKRSAPLHTLAVSSVT